MMRGLDQHIAKANARLKAENVRCRIGRDPSGGTLYLRASFPPKPGSEARSTQRRVYPGFAANSDGLDLAIAEARLVSALLGRGEFDWSRYGVDSPSQSKTVDHWLARFEEDFWDRHEPGERSALLWRVDYRAPFRLLPADQALTADLLAKALTGLPVASRSRDRAIKAYRQLARFAGLETAAIDRLRGSYGPKQVSPRDLPTDAAIVAAWEACKDRRLAWCLGMLAAYGFRVKELWSLGLEAWDGLEVEVFYSKTDRRRLAYPLPRDWVDRFGLRTVPILPSSPAALAQLWRRNPTEIPFDRQDLRHAAALRGTRLGYPPQVVAQWLGHDLATHLSRYHAHADRSHYKEIYESRQPSKAETRST